MSTTYCVAPMILLLQLNRKRKSRQLTDKGNFVLRKWASNSKEVMNAIPMEHRAIQLNTNIDNNDTVKTLGVFWNAANDKLEFKVDMSTLSEKSLTKRSLLSKSSKLFDPCGLLSPITINAKIFMQELWIEETNWDDLLPSSIKTKWIKYKEELPLIENIDIARFVQTTKNSKVSLHGFCDISNRAYACALYLIQKGNEQKITSTLICSKTKVAPIKVESIPRLELCGAVLLSKLIKRVAQILDIKLEAVNLWPDSSEVLTWIKAHPSKWSTYVANRVGEIQRNFTTAQWRHVRSVDNPADIASRGAMPSELINNKMWFHGPEWLCQREEMWPQNAFNDAPIETLEAKNNEISVKLTKAHIDCSILSAFSNLHKLVKITARMLRFIYQCRKQEVLKYTKEIVEPDEYKRAKYFWVKFVQNDFFQSEIDAINKNKFVGKKSDL